MKTAVQIFGYHHAEHNLLEAVFLSFASLETTSFSKPNFVPLVQIVINLIKF